MLEHYLEAPHALRQLRAGRAGALMDGFALALRTAGFSRRTAQDYFRVAAHLDRWAQRRHIELARIDERVVDRFLCHLKEHGRRRRRDRVRSGARQFLAYLRSENITPEAQPASPSRSTLIDDFVVWMEQRGVRIRTLGLYAPIVGRLIAALGDDPRRFDATGVRRFILDEAARGKPGMTKRAISAVRIFLRCLAAHGRCPPDLWHSVPAVASWRLSALPRYLPAAHVERVIATCDPTTIVGARDRAMLLLLARLGLRASDVVGLRLGDIDWSRGRIRVVGKSRRETWLPLPQEVGDAVLSYLKTGRPTSVHDHVFLRVRAPVRPLHPATITSLVERAIATAGIDARFRGAHVLRHSAATQMLREGLPLDLIGTMLRHRSVDTTALYAKVDVVALREVAQPWPALEVR